MKRLRKLDVAEKPNAKDYNALVDRLNIMSKIQGINVYGTLTQNGYFLKAQAGSEATATENTYAKVVRDLTAWSIENPIHPKYYECRLLSDATPDWATGTLYVVDTVVVKEDIPYTCNTEHTSSSVNAPPNEAFWTENDTLFVYPTGPKFIGAGLKDSSYDLMYCEPVLLKDTIIPVFVKDDTYYAGITIINLASSQYEYSRTFSSGRGMSVYR